MKNIGKLVLKIACIAILGIGFIRLVIYLDQTPQNNEYFSTYDKFNLDLYSQERVLVKHSDLELSNESKVELTFFENNHTYYAVFVVNIKEKTEHWLFGNSLEKIKYAVMQQCKTSSINAEDCILYETIVPKGYSPKDGKITLSAELTEPIANTLRVNGDFPLHAAIAANNVGIYSWVFKRLILKRAKQQVLEDCKARTNTFLRESQLTTGNGIPTNFFECEIILSY